MTIRPRSRSQEAHHLANHLHEGDLPDGLDLGPSVAVDSEAMGLDPNRVWHLNRAARFLGNGSYERIDLLAEGLPQRTVPFDVLPEFAHLQIRG